MSRILRLALLAIVVLSVPQTCRAGYLVYTATLNGATEIPPTPSLATGFVEVDLDTTLNTMHVHASFSGLIGTTAAAHIHAATSSPFTGTAGVATTVPTFSGFPLGVQSGTFDMTFDMTQLSSYNPSYVTAQGGTTAGAEAALFASIAAGTSYFNIHTSVYPGGEIEGFLVPVPEPSSLVLCGIGGAVGLVIARSRRRRIA